MKHIVSIDRFIFNCQNISNYSIAVIGNIRSIRIYNDPNQSISTMMFESEDINLVDQIYRDLISFLSSDDRVLNVPELQQRYIRELPSKTRKAT